MSWDGVERRQETREYCSQHQKQSNDIVEIKTILQGIDKNLTQGITFKTAIVSSLIGVVLVLMVQLATFAFLYGKVTERVDRNTGIIETMRVDMNKLQQGSSK